MVDVFTPRVRLNQQEVGAKIDVWGPDHNTGVVALLEQAVAGKADVDVTAGNILLTAVNGGSDTQRPAILRVFGTPGVTRDITVPDPPTQKFYVIHNASDSTVNLRTVTNTGVAVGIGQTLLCIVDEVLDNVFAITLAGSAVLEAANWLTGTADISGSSPLQTINYRYSVQGDIGMMLIPAFGPFNVVINNLSLDPNTPASWPVQTQVLGSSQVDAGYLNHSVSGRFAIVCNPPFGSSLINLRPALGNAVIASPGSFTLETPVNLVFARRVAI